MWNTQSLLHWDLSFIRISRIHSLLIFWFALIFLLNGISRVRLALIFLISGISRGRFALSFLCSWISRVCFALFFKSFGISKARFATILKNAKFEASFQYRRHCYWSCIVIEIISICFVVLIENLLLAGISITFLLNLQSRITPQHLHSRHLLLT